MGITGLAVGTALAGAVTNVGLALALCLLGSNGQPVVADRQEFCRKCLLLALSCGVIALFVRDGTLSYTGTGLLMLLFVIFVLSTSTSLFMASGTNRSLPTAAPPSPRRRITATLPAQWPSP